ncbi:hypothetical protein [Maribacter flavus]|uniref:Uncharacterized protein n=1 Tax=Maribacter flavus TaxID=1658664 RepID=A0A5B2TXH2_9FLAO|nr:hypothetical protein [Maribacter flavus]KAA2218525.1 hypothetical protein F0361_02570 [Maribacter flavus]
MKNENIHFERTLAIYETLCTKLNGNFEPSWRIFYKNQRTLNSQVKNFLTQIEITQRDLLNEIFQIETVKFKLRNTSNEIERIFHEEKELARKGDNYLNMNFKDLKDLFFRINPRVQIFVSNWEWVCHENRKKSFEFIKNVATKKSEYYFLLERTGTFDDKLNSNVFEIALSEFEYILLNQFTTKRKIGGVYDDFKKLFNYENEIEEGNLDELIIFLIRKIIFKTYIIPN